MDHDTALVTAFNHIYCPVFAKVAADLGATFRTEQELVEALESVAAIKKAMAEKAEPADGSHTKEAHDLLFGRQTKQAAQDVELPAELNAALSLL